MSLVSQVETLIKRPLTSAEMANLADLQRINGIDDSDPLIVVLALMAKSQIITESLPELLQQKALETIELHRQTLREQSSLIAKELIIEIANSVVLANNHWQARWLRYGGFFVGGALFTAALTYFIRH